MRLALILSILFTSIPYLPINTWATCPDEHMLYSKEAVHIMDRAKIQGGSIRAVATVEVGFDAQVHGDVLGQNVILKDRAVIQGNMTTSASLTRSSSAVVSGTIAQNTVLPPCTLSEKPTIAFGSVDKTVPWDSQATVPPGSYRDLLVRSRGTVRFTPGVYNFRKVILEPDAKIRVQTGGNLDINVEEQIFLDGRIKMALVGQGVFPNVRIYSNQTTVLKVGHDSRLFGTLAVPKAEVRFLERTALQGRILAAMITVETDAIVSASLDTDGDGVPDLVENMLGADPGNSSNKPALGVPTKWFMDPSVDNIISYNYGSLPGYSHRSNVLVNIPSGALISNLAPIVQVKDVTDPAVPSMTLPTSWQTKGKVFEIKGSVRDDRKILFGFPLPDGTPSSVKEHKLVVYHYTNSAWKYVPVEYVANGIAYCNVSTFSPFVVLQNTDSSSVIYVNSEQRFIGGDGKSWATAYGGLRAALSDANITKKEIWVAGERPGGGTLGYVLISDSVPDVAYMVPDGVRLYGGFWGHVGSARLPNTERSQRNLNFKSEITTEAYKPDSIVSKAIKYTNRIFKLGNDAIIDGFELWATFATRPVNGRGIIIENAAATIANCHFSDIRGTNGHGGAVFVTGSNGQANIINSLFQDNLANGWNGGAVAAVNGARLSISSGAMWINSGINGGAIYLENASASIEGVRFIRNTSQKGGSIYAKNSRLEVRDCLFDSNSTTLPNEGHGGAIYVDSLSKVFLSGSTLTGNRAGGNGGGIAIFSKDSATLVSSRFISNVAVGGGGGVFNFSSSPFIDKCAFFRNAAGGGGGIYNKLRSSPLIRNTVLAENSAQSDAFGGAGILNMESSSPTIRNCTIFRNSTEPSSALGGGVFSFLSSSPLIENTIVWGNRAYENPEIGGQHGNTSFQNSLVKGFDKLKFGVDSSTALVPPIDLGGNLGQDTVAHNPRFRNAALPAGMDAVFMTSDDGLVLQQTSPALNAGISSSGAYEDILSTLRPIGNGVDIGAYEFDNRVPVVLITSPSKAITTVVNRSPVKISYTVDGQSKSKDATLLEGLNKVIVDTTYSNGERGADSVNIFLDTQGPDIRITFPGRDSAVDTSAITIRYTSDGVPGTKAVNLQTGYNYIPIEAYDSLGNLGTAVRIIGRFPSGSHLTATAKTLDTIFTYQLSILEGGKSTAPTGAPLKYQWRQIQGASVFINSPASRVAGFVSRGQDRLAFELKVSDEAGVFPVSLDTVVIEVLEPVNVLGFAQALEEAKSNQDGAFALTIAPAGEVSRYTLENSISLQGSLSGTSGAFGMIRWYCNGRTGAFRPPGENWNSPAIALDPGDNWITLVYTQGSQIASDRILVSRGEVDMVGFDMNPNVLWADSAMSFKLVVNVYDPALSNIHLVRITDHEVDMGELVDNGTGGDDFASDRRYTLQFDLTPNADSVYWFRVKANKSGVNSYSALYTFHPQQKYNPTTFQDILNVHANASALFEVLQATKSEKAAMDSVANWLIEQPSVTTAGIGPGEKAICWQYINGVHSMISNAPDGTRGGGKIKLKGLSPFNFDIDPINPSKSAFGPNDDGITAYRGILIPVANADTSLYDADSLLINSTSKDSNVTIDNWKNWTGYKAVSVATHGNTFGYDSLSQVRRKPTQDLQSGASLWAKPYVTLLSYTKADTSIGSKYWADLTSGGRKGYPRMILVGKKSPIYGITSKFFATYNKNLGGSLLSLGACRSLYNNNLWDAVRANGDTKTAMIGYTDYVDGSFAGKASEIIFKGLVKGKTLKQSVDSVVTFCGQITNGFCYVNNGKAWDSLAYLEIRGDSNYTLVPRKGRAWAWGSGRGSLNNCVSAIADTVPIIKNITKVSGGFGHGLALEVNGTVWGWGWNGAGQLGAAPSGGGGSVPTVNYRSCTPRQVFPGTGYKAIAAGTSRSLAVDAAGKVWRAGEYTGSSTIGWTTDSRSNTWAAGVVGVVSQRDSVAGLSNIVTVAAGASHNLALDANGEVWAWGANISGELGFGDTLPRPIPAKIPGLANIVAIAAGQDFSNGPSSSHSLALDRSGKVWTWGENAFGQLGVGDTTDRKSPQPLSGLSRIKYISAGVGGSSAVDSTGKLWVWGWNAQGQLGLGNTNDQKVPVQVPALSSIASVAHGVFPVVLDNSGRAMWSCGSACGNTYVSKKPGSLEVGAGGDEFGLSVAP